MTIKLNDIRIGDEIAVRMKVKSVNDSDVSAEFSGCLDEDTWFIAPHEIVTHTKAKKKIAVGDRVFKTGETGGPGAIIGTVLAIDGDHLWVSFASGVTPVTLALAEYEVVA